LLRYGLPERCSPPKPAFGSNKDRFVSDARPQSALREWRDHLRHPATLVAMGAVALILALIGPYGTSDLLRPLPRFGYWALIVPATYGAGSLVVTWLRAVLPPWPFALRMGLAGVTTGLAVAGVVLGVNALALGFVPAPDALPGFVGNVAGVAMVVTLAIAYVTRQHTGATPVRPAPPTILQRVPLEKRGALLALSVEDHYVKVHTSNGTEMLLMRLSDAMREVGDLRGAQVHRSHWVAFNAVRAARRDGDRAILTLTTGTDIPVSRANMSKVKEAGLLPR
jgi:hypothetical protein